VIGTFSAFVDVAIVGGAAGLGVIVAASGYRAAFLASAIVAAAGLPLLTRLERRPAEAPHEVASSA
jgi:predicted MFS family arabinose efflux permease